MFKSGTQSSNFKIGSNNFSGVTSGRLFKQYNVLAHPEKIETMDAWGFRARGA
jgi:hypothetical protein